jgi:1-pyrroline-5-carboxylate dehydrogenase
VEANVQKITYATVYTQGLTDAELGEAFERTLEDLRTGEPRVCPHRIGSEELTLGRRFERTEPSAPHRAVGVAWEADEDLVSRAVAAARQAFPGWRRTELEERCELLRRVAGVIGERRLDLASLLAFEIGKTRADAFAEVDECIAIVELYAEQMHATNGFNVQLEPPSERARAEAVYLPYGVFGIIAPFNFPLAIPVGMIAAALVTGNTAVFKPSALAPTSGDALFEIFERAGVPQDVLVLVQGGAPTGQHLAASAVDGIAFTGSAEVGLSLVQRLAAPPFLRPVIAEMGGKNPAVVTANAPSIEVAAQAVARSAFGMSGQKCNACSRAIVTADVYDDFVDALCAFAESLAVADPIDAGAFTGPLISDVAKARFLDAVAAAQGDGQIRTGGHALRGDGHFVELTVIDGLPAGHRFTREELFVPLLCVVRVNGFDEALSEANAVRFGLAAGLLSDEPGERTRFLEAIEAGIVFVSTPAGATTGVWPGSQTMAGWKASGTSGKGGFGPYYLLQFMREQSRTIAV